MLSDEAVVVAIVLDNVVFNCEVFPLMALVREEFKVDCMYCFNRGNIINRGHVCAYT